MPVASRVGIARCARMMDNKSAGHARKRAFRREALLFRPRVRLLAAAGARGRPRPGTTVGREGIGATVVLRGWKGHSVKGGTLAKARVNPEQCARGSAAAVVTRDVGARKPLPQTEAGADGACAQLAERPRAKRPA